MYFVLIQKILAIKVKVCAGLENVREYVPSNSEAYVKGPCFK